MTASLRFTVTEASEPCRLDRWLANELDDVASREQLQGWLKAGHVKLNNQVITRPATIPKLNDVVTLTIPPTEPLHLAAENIPLEVIYEDDECLVVNKPRGMLTHPAGKHVTGTLVNALLHHCNQALSNENGPVRPGIVHRLDRDTSGLLMVAKTNASHRALQTQLQARSAKRRYIAITHGIPKANIGRIDAPLGRNPKRRDTQMVRPDGRHATTHWTVLETAHHQFAKVSFQLETGRTHQIRVHCQHKGFPIIGDELYGSGLAKQWQLPTQGQCLQAVELAFQHPKTQQLCKFTLPEEAIITTIWEKLCNN